MLKPGLKKHKKGTILKKTNSLILQLVWFESRAKGKRTGLQELTTVKKNQGILLNPALYYFNYHNWS